MLDKVSLIALYYIRFEIVKIVIFIEKLLFNNSVNEDMVDGKQEIVCLDSQRSAFRFL